MQVRPTHLFLVLYHTPTAQLYDVGHDMFVQDVQVRRIRGRHPGSGDGPTPKTTFDTRIQSFWCLDRSAILVRLLLLLLLLPTHRIDSLPCEFAPYRVFNMSFASAMLVGSQHVNLFPLYTQETRPIDPRALQRGDTPHPPSSSPPKDDG